MGRKATEGVSSGRLMRQHTPPLFRTLEVCRVLGGGGREPLFSLLYGFFVCFHFRNVDTHFQKSARTLSLLFNTFKVLEYVTPPHSAPLNHKFSIPVIGFLVLSS